MERVREANEGIAIEMVIDRSSSMAAEMNFENRRLNRLEVVKEVFERFVLGDGKDLKGRGNDLVGMISFAQFPETVCPLTLGHGALPQFLETVRLAQPRSQEDGTAIGMPSPWPPPGLRRPKTSWPAKFRVRPTSSRSKARS